MSIKGIDVAKYQPTNPDPAALPGVKFYIAKATEGLTPDPTYKAHIMHAREHDIQAIGAYHFVHASVSIKAQVDAFLKAAGDVDGYVVDREGSDLITKSQFVEFQSRMADAGKRTGLYGPYLAYGGYPLWGQDWNWIAYYHSTPPTTKPWDIWQYGPYASNVDGDIYEGTVEQLLALWSGQVAQAPITSETPMLITTSAGKPWYDLDGVTIVVPSAQALTDPRPSPYAAGSKRAMYATVGGKRRTVLVVPATTAPVPAPDCQPLIDAAVQQTKDAAHIVTVPASQHVEF